MTQRERLPDFLVVGAPKAGTTSLYRYLADHPQIFVPAQKELHFFTHDLIAARAQGPGDAAVVAGLCREKSHYRRFFAQAGSARAVGEVSPSYLYHSVAAERIWQRLGPVKIVMSLRNPVEKAISQYQHQRRDGVEPLSLAAALDAEAERAQKGWRDFWLYARSSCYADKVAVYLDRFGPSRVHVIRFEDLAADPVPVLAALYAFLGVDPAAGSTHHYHDNPSGRARSAVLTNLLMDDGRLKRVIKAIVPARVRLPLRLALMRANTGQKEAVPSAVRDRLATYFAEDVARLEALLDRPMHWF